VLLTTLSSVDQFVIGSVMGVASVSHYFVPMSLVQRSLAHPDGARADSVSPHVKPVWRCGYPVITFPIAVFIRAVSFVLGYSFSADWRSLTLAQINRARVFLNNLTNRVKRSLSVNTSVQK
jgi:hypothetical protein